MHNQSSNESSILQIILLILAGEAIFILPFVLARIFRPTFLDVFNLNNLELGICFSVYGIVALLSYLYGGAIADKFAPKKLIATALWLTGLGGFVMATYPSYFTLKCLFAYWGFTTIFLFWGAMIKATRSWGGNYKQGRAFGFLEGGRGFVAASIGAIGVYIFSLFLPNDFETASLVERQTSFKYVILGSSITVIFIGFLVYFLMKRSPVKTVASSTNATIKNVLKIPSVWLLMIIVLSGYVGYKLTDIFSLYASEIMLFNELEAAQVGTFQLYMRPIVCIIVGLLADKTKSIFWLIIGFIVMLIGATLFATGFITQQLYFLFFLSLIIVAIGTYSVRTLYFAVLAEGNIPLAVTGTAVGIISVIGYTPDIFVGPIMGYLLDNFPGITGHQYIFTMLMIFASTGLLSALFFNKINAKKLP